MNNRQAGKRVLVLILVLTTGLFSGCTGKPLLAVSGHSLPSFADDLDREGLKPAIMNSLDYYGSLPPHRKIGFAGRTITVAQLTRSLEVFLSLLGMNLSDEDLDRAIREHFDVYQAGGTGGYNPRHHMLVTGYFHPLVEGSLTLGAPFLHPLYTVPDDLVHRADARGEKIIGRIDNGALVPYWTRREIEQQGRAAGHELVWLRDPFDAFVLHIQGSGLIRLRDGSVRGVRYAARNGREYRSIGRYLVDTGRLRLADASLDSIRDYLAAHPEERDDILHHNDSFIFFSWAANRSAVGNLGRELTPGRSIAVDQSCFPPGSLGFLMTRKPALTGEEGVQWSPLHRFVLVQDTGSAMRGPGRVDLFWGAGPTAGSEAGMMKEKGMLYFLLVKEKFSAQTALTRSGQGVV